MAPYRNPYNRSNTASAAKGRRTCELLSKKSAKSYSSSVSYRALGSSTVRRAATNVYPITTASTRRLFAKAASGERISQATKRRLRTAAGNALNSGRWLSANGNRVYGRQQDVNAFLRTL